MLFILHIGLMSVVDLLSFLQYYKHDPSFSVSCHEHCWHLEMGHGERI